MSFYLKHSDTPNLLHVYEHVISLCIHRKLQQNGYNPYVDYALKGETHDSGYSVISLEIYNKRAKGIVNPKYLNELTVDDRDVYVGYLQVLAEEGITFRFVKPGDDLMGELNRLHATPWVEEASHLDDTGRQIIKDKTLGEDSPIGVADYSMSLNLGNTDLNGAALEGVAAVIGHTAQASLSNQRGYYREVMKVTKTGLHLGYRVAEVLIDDISIEDDLFLSKEIVRNLIHSQSFRTLLMELLGQQDISMALASIEGSVETWSVQDCLVRR